MNGSKEREMRTDCDFKISAYEKHKGDGKVAWERGKCETSHVLLCVWNSTSISIFMIRNHGQLKETKLSSPLIQINPFCYFGFLDICFCLNRDTSPVPFPYRLFVSLVHFYWPPGDHHVLIRCQDFRNAGKGVHMLATVSSVCEWLCVSMCEWLWVCVVRDRIWPYNVMPEVCILWRGLMLLMVNFMLYIRYHHHHHHHHNNNNKNTRENNYCSHSSFNFRLQIEWKMLKKTFVFFFFSVLHL